VALQMEEDAAPATSHVHSHLVDLCSVQAVNIVIYRYKAPLPRLRMRRAQKQRKGVWDHTPQQCLQQ
jgi:hypothetical protein